MLSVIRDLQENYWVQFKTRTGMDKQVNDRPKRKMNVANEEDRIKFNDKSRQSKRG